MYSMYKQGMFESGTERYDLVENGMFTEDEIKEYEKGNTSLTLEPFEQFHPNYY